jgi:hypothetical protein
MVAELQRFMLGSAALATVALVRFVASAQSAYDVEQLHPNAPAAALAARATETPAQKAAT